ncbi:heparan sulfate glucosamine 3-O-sulfotransferase 2-like [Zophobas morio]|uniref:heparan sulfate glucosamine 3-O-sulfotransferase 2-like n=1 Tax=Zophobas morio TaxID=2755281 RepID=UPI003082EF48
MHKLIHSFVIVREPVKRFISNYTQAVSKKPEMKTSSSWSSCKPHRQHSDMSWEPFKLGMYIRTEKTKKKKLGMYSRCLTQSI